MNEKPFWQYLLEDVYGTNQDFKDYVDKYCTKHRKNKEDAVHDVLVWEYFQYLKENNRI